MNKADRKHNFAMTLLFAVIIFCVLAASIVLGVIILFPLTYFGVISGADGGDPGSSAALLLLLLVSLLIGAAITLIMSRILQKPFSHFISLTNRMAAGDFKVRLTFGRLFRSHPSFAALADSFNTMAQELENTELLRSDFVNNFSHEFKTPIVSIAGFAKLLRRGDRSEAQQDEYLAIIEEESLRLAAMANNVLALTKIESQTILTDVTEFNLSEQLRSCVLLLEDRWTKKELTPVWNSMNTASPPTRSCSVRCGSTCWTMPSSSPHRAVRSSCRSPSPPTGWRSPSPTPARTSRPTSWIRSGTVSIRRTNPTPPRATA